MASYAKKLKAARQPGTWTDWHKIARKAKKRAKKNPMAPAYLVPGLYSPGVAHRLKNGRHRAFSPAKRWWIISINRDNVEPGKVQLQVEYRGKDGLGFRHLVD